MTQIEVSQGQTSSACSRVSGRTSYLALGILCALMVSVARADLAISEFLAGNDGGLRDAEGDTPDWIELRNDSASVASLDGWHLTDDPSALAKWTFPATNLPSGGYLVVFASGKDRRVAGAELHANFRLSRDGGYLALVAPDGTSVAQAVNYPAQRANVSFGPGRTVLSTPLLSSGAAARVFVPGDDALGTNWTSRTFNDSGWFPSNAPVGFHAAGLVTPLLSLDFNERGVDAALATQQGFSSFVIQSNLSTTAIQTQATTRTFGGISVTVSNTVPFGYDDRARPLPANSGDFSEALLLRDFVFSMDRTGTGGLDVTIEGLTPNLPHRVTIWSYDAGSAGSRVANWSANGSPLITQYTFNGSVLPTSDSQYQFTADASADANGRIRITGRRDPSSVSSSGSADFGVFLNAFHLAAINPPSAPTGLGLLMISNNASAYLRIPFQVTAPDAISALRLSIGYDDGFIAYLNGREIASRNAPASATWNATATTAHGGSVEDISIIPPPGLLVSGDNVLAIHGLNVTDSDPTFLVAPELAAEEFIETSGRYLSPPTPGTANGPQFDGLVADTKFSVNRGFFDAPFSLSITSATPGVQIRYTTNGSIPSLSNGTTFTTPIVIDRNGFIRAAAFKTGWVPSDVDTHSYIFLRDVALQSNSLPGYPTTWQANYPADYGMDPEIVNHPVYGPALSNALRSIPSLMIVSDQNGLWNASTGIYPNSTSRGTAWEREASFELISGDGSTEFAVTAKLEMHGNASRDNVRTPKHSMHAVFNSDYGPTRLRHDWFDDNIENHNKIIFRSCGFVDGWAGRYADNSTYTSSETGESFRGLRYRPENTCYLRDAWVKDSFGAMGWLASRSQYVHLYLNGLYWGLYEPSESPDASFFASHLGGPEGAWDVLVGEDNNGPPVIVDGSGVAWSNVLAMVNAGITTEAAYAAITNQVDIDNLIDYMLIHIFAEAEDWPRHNWYLARRRATNDLPATKFIFTVWDQELSLDRLVRRNRVNVGNGGEGAGELYSPARIYARLRNWPEFRRQFGDRVHKHLFNGGALTPAANAARLLEPAALIREAVIGESARWGDARETGVPAGQIGTGKTFTRDEWWQPEINKLATNFFSKLTADNVARLRTAQLYPNVAAPEFNQFGGEVAADFDLILTHTNASGVIYYTTDGSDPRTYGSGAVAATAVSYSQPVSFNGPTRIRARVLASGSWSALCEADFYPPQDLSRLALTEVMYHPAAEGIVDGDEFEFIELKNTGAQPLNLSGLRFEGITFTFTNGTVLDPGTFFVLVRNPVTFADRYPGAPVHGVYSGALNNAGENLRLTTPFDRPVLTLNYDDETPWPSPADGFGFSLVPRTPAALQAPDTGSAWRASAFVGGSPGSDDPEPSTPPIVINEILSASVPPEVDRIELFNPTASAVNVGGWLLSDTHDVPAKFQIPPGTTISAGGYLVFDETDFNSSPGTDLNFSLSSRGEALYLFSADANTNLTGYSHSVAFDASDPGVTFGRYVTSVGAEQFPAQSSTTFGVANSGPRVGPVVISEIHYNPGPQGDEFIELQNLPQSPVSLFAEGSPTNVWRMAGLNFEFPPATTFVAGGRLLIVSTNPAAFRAKHSVPAEVAIFGPYAGELQDSGERLRLQRPLLSETNPVVFVTVDEVRYNDKAPWPPSADGAGLSLQRRAVGEYGDDPINWTAASPTPGTSMSSADFDGDGLPDDWENANGTDWLVPDADGDLDNDGATNLAEFRAGTDPRSATSRLHVTASIEAGDVVQLQFNALPDRSYTIQYKSTLDAGTWSALEHIPAAPNERVITIQDTPGGGTGRYYRVVTPQQP